MGAVVLSIPRPGEEGDWLPYYRAVRTAFDLLRAGLPAAVCTESSSICAQGDLVFRVGQPWLDHLVSFPGCAQIEKWPDVGVMPVAGYPRILLSAQTWAGAMRWYHDCLSLAGLDFTLLYDDASSCIDEQAFDVIIQPGSRGGSLVPPLHEAAMRRFVASGGAFLGSCWGASMALQRHVRPRANQVADTTGGQIPRGAGLIDAWPAGIERTRMDLGGVGQVVLRNNQPSHPVMWGLPDSFIQVYWDGPLFGAGPGVDTLAPFVDIVPARFRHHGNDPIESRIDYEEEKGKPAFLASCSERGGKVMLFGNHPEASSSANPFGQSDTGYRVIYNSLIYAMCRGPTSLDHWMRQTDLESNHPAQTRVTPGNWQDEATELSWLTDHVAEASDAGISEIRSLTARAQEVFMWLKSPRTLSEDSMLGTHVLRLVRSLVQISTVSRRASSLASDPSSKAAQSAADWLRRALSTVNALLCVLKTLYLPGMCDPTYWWYPISGPAAQIACEGLRLWRTWDLCQLQNRRLPGRCARALREPERAGVSEALLRPDQLNEWLGQIGCYSHVAELPAAKTLIVQANTVSLYLSPDTAALNVMGKLIKTWEPPVTYSDGSLMVRPWCLDLVRKWASV